LISRISNRDHVKVEGWTLLGTMLGVFPVCVWTKERSDGWEARVEARTLSGAIVGAAEAECLRSEKLWSNRDDYALRSMAQTRATSKALRQPLGFVMSLAGFDPTPAEEAPEKGGPPERRQEGPPPVPVPKTWAKVRELVEKSCDNAVDAWLIFEAFVRAASYHEYGETDSKKLTDAQKKLMLQKAAGAAVALAENKGFPEEKEPPFRIYDVEVQQKAWAVVTNQLLEIPDYEPPEPPVDPEVEAQREAEAAQ
jgi:hypothetical protein